MTMNKNGLENRFGTTVNWPETPNKFPDFCRDRKRLLGVVFDGFDHMFLVFHEMNSSILSKVSDHSTLIMIAIVSIQSNMFHFSSISTLPTLMMTQATDVRDSRVRVCIQMFFLMEFAASIFMRTHLPWYMNGIL
jgi:hypothetical protein